MKRSVNTAHKGTIIFARGVVYLLTIVGLVVCFILLPELAREESAGKSDVTVPVLSVSYLLATPIFIALYQTHKLLNLIDRGKFFTTKSIKALQNIRTCAIVFSILVMVLVITGIMLIRVIDPGEDPPPFPLFGMILAFVSSVIAVFAAVLKKLLSDAIAMKSENDLII